MADGPAAVEVPHKLADAAAKGDEEVGEDDKPGVDEQEVGKQEDDKQEPPGHVSCDRNSLG